MNEICMENEYEDTVTLWKWDLHTIRYGFGVWNREFASDSSNKYGRWIRVMTISVELADEV